MADTVRGDGLIRADRALAALAEDSQRLDHARRRFSDSPPSYTSHQSHNSTLSQSPNPRSEEQRRREERQVQLTLERWASRPYDQFAAQNAEERERIIEAISNRTCRVPGGTDFETLAHENVKKRWVEQGIWNNKWNSMANGSWKHEEPLELEWESSDAEPPFPVFSFSQTKAEAKPRQPKSDEEERRIAERQATQEREREASRPFYQFVYQVSKERERMQDESGVGDATVPASADINTRAYENVKNKWIKRGIWHKEWGILPGMSWKHEEPLAEETADDPAPFQANPLWNSSHETGEAPITHIFEHAQPIESNHRRASGISNACEQGRPADIDPAGLGNGNAEHAPSESCSPRPRRARRVTRPSAGQAPQPSKRKPSPKGGQIQPRLSTSPGTVPLSKVSKASRRKKRPGLRRRPNAPEEISSGDPPLLPGSDIAEPPVRTASIPPRRSRRLPPPAPNMAKDPVRFASTGSLNGILRSRPKKSVR